MKAKELVNRKNREFAESLQNIKPAVAISAMHNHKIYSDYSRPCDPLIIKPLIRKSLRNLKDESGTYVNIYANNGVNIVGNCAEINAASKVYIDDKLVDLREIYFSDPLRPRTLQVVKRCKNCETIFGEE